jgi:poly(A) polymerase
VVAAQAQHVAIPRRFTHMMEDIWELQPRFAHRTRKRAFRLLEHQRFRAAYDFLLLRAGESEDIRELGQWWTEAQEMPSDELADQLGAAAPRSGTSTRKRRRRRRGGRKKAGSDKPE